MKKLIILIIIVATLLVSCGSLDEAVVYIGGDPWYCSRYQTFWWDHPTVARPLTPPPPREPVIRVRPHRKDRKHTPKDHGRDSHKLRQPKKGV
jgi:uncharacterized protein YcfL